MRGLHPLAKYPGPLLASLTNGWKAYHVYKLFLKSSSSFINNMDQLCGWARIIIYGMETPSLLFTKAVAQWANPSFMMRLRLSIQISLELRMMMWVYIVTTDRPTLFIDDSFLTDSPRLLLRNWSLWLKVKWSSSRISYTHLHRPEKYSTWNCYFRSSSVAFGKPFGAQQRGYEEVLPAINDHLLLADIVGELPLQNVTKAISRWSPIPWMGRLMKKRDALKRSVRNASNTR